MDSVEARRAVAVLDWMQSYRKGMSHGYPSFISWSRVTRAAWVERMVKGETARTVDREWLWK